MTTDQNFGQALQAMQGGLPVSRAAWSATGMLVFMQIPSEVPIEMIHRMTSLPTVLKATAMERGLPLRYANQFGALHLDNIIHGWTPTSSDILATDWCIHNPYAVARGTVGAAIPNPKFHGNRGV